MFNFSMVYIMINPIQRRLDYFSVVENNVASIIVFLCFADASALHIVLE